MSNFPSALKESVQRLKDAAAEIGSPEKQLHTNYRTTPLGLQLEVSFGSEFHPQVIPWFELEDAGTHAKAEELFMATPKYTNRNGHLHP